jgi:steroid delta-isomerase-like uncharacterized protein
MTTTSPINTVPVSTKLAVFRRFVDDILNHGRFEAMTELVHPDYRYHGPDGGQIAGRDGLQELLAGFRSAFPDLHARITTEIEDDRYVAATMLLTGTHNGDFEGMPPTGRQLELPIAIVTRFADRQIIEDREYYDTATMVTQLTGRGAGETQGRQCDRCG